MTQPEYVYPTVAGRRKLLVQCVAVVVLLGLLYLFLTHQYEQFRLLSEKDRAAAIERTVLTLRLLAVGCAVLLLALSWRVHRAGQLPARGATVFVRTRVRRGWPVRVFVAVHATLAATLLAFAFGAVQ